MCHASALRLVIFARTMLALVLLSLAVAPSARAVQPDEVLSDPVLEARARALSRMLRCMVCQNQSIDDSDAPLARDLRILVRERILAGDTDEEVINFLVTRYGEFVLLKPRVTWRTSLLWAGPPLMLIAGAFVLFLFVRRRRNQEVTVSAGNLTPGEEARLADLLHPDKR